MTNNKWHCPCGHKSKIFRGPTWRINSAGGIITDNPNATWPACPTCGKEAEPTTGIEDGETIEVVE